MVSLIRSAPGLLQFLPCSESFFSRLEADGEYPNEPLDLASPCLLDIATSYAVQSLQ